MGKKIFVTGATGFIGSFIVEEALRQGYEVWAAIRKSSSLKYLSDERIHLLEVNLSDGKILKEQLSSFDFDYVVHAAGVTKCLNSNDFFVVNVEGTRNLVSAIRDNGMHISKFVYISSLSVFGPVRENRPYRDICDTDEPKPDTAYGKSKLAAEHYLSTLKDFPYVILRPTGVYGPREKDYFMMAKSIKGHVDFSVGYRPQVLTFVYVKDVVQAVFLSIDKGRVGACYFLSDGSEYTSRSFSDLIKRELGIGFLLRIKAPLWVLKIVTTCGERIGHVTGRVSALNNDKYNIMKQRNWRCDISPAVRDLGYRPGYDLERGVRETIKWYKDNNWL